MDGSKLLPFVACPGLFPSKAKVIHYVIRSSSLLLEIVFKYGVSVLFYGVSIFSHNITRHYLFLFDSLKLLLWSYFNRPDR